MFQIDWKCVKMIDVDIKRCPYQRGGPYHIETSPLICRVNQKTCWYMIETSVMKEFMMGDNISSSDMIFGFE